MAAAETGNPSCGLLYTFIVEKHLAFAVGKHLAFIFERLAVYQKSIDLAGRILIATSKFPRRYGFLSGQLNRKRVSIAANIDEGNGRFTIHDRGIFL